MHRCKLLYKHSASSGDKKFKFIIIKIYVPIYINLKNRYTIKKNTTNKKNSSRTNYIIKIYNN